MRAGWMGHGQGSSNVRRFLLVWVDAGVYAARARPLEVSYVDCFAIFLCAAQVQTARSDCHLDRRISSASSMPISGHCMVVVQHSGFHARLPPEECSMPWPQNARTQGGLCRSLRTHRSSPDIASIVRLILCSRELRLLGTYTNGPLQAMLCEVQHRDTTGLASVYLSTMAVSCTRAVGSTPPSKIVGSFPCLCSGCRSETLHIWEGRLHTASRNHRCNKGIAFVEHALRRLVVVPHCGYL